MSHKVVDYEVNIDSEADINYRSPIFPSLDELEHKDIELIQDKEELENVVDQEHTIHVQVEPLTVNVELGEADEDTIDQEKIDNITSQIDVRDTSTENREIKNIVSNKVIEGEIKENLSDSGTIDREDMDVPQIDRELPIESDRQISQDQTDNFEDDNDVTVLGEADPDVNRTFNQSRDRDDKINIELDVIDTDVADNYEINDDEVSTEDEREVVESPTAVRSSNTKIDVGNIRKSASVNDPTYRESLNTSFGEIDEDSIPTSQKQIRNELGELSQRTQNLQNSETTSSDTSNDLTRDDSSELNDSEINDSSLQASNIQDNSRANTENFTDNAEEIYNISKNLPKSDPQIRKLSKKEQLSIVHLLLASFENLSIVPVYDVMDPDVNQNIESLVQNAIESEYDKVLAKVTRIVEGIST